jgi:hypothetical protein
VGFFLAGYLAVGPVPVFAVLFTDEVSHLQPPIGLGAYPISCGGMIVESVDALKGAIGPLSLDGPLIAVTKDNVKDRLLGAALGHRDAIAENNDSLETIPYPSCGHPEAQMGLRFSSCALLRTGVPERSFRKRLNRRPALRSALGANCRDVRS